MSVQTCRVENGTVTITDGHLTCHPINDQPVSKVIITGRKDFAGEPAISITNSNVTVELQVVNINAETPFTSDRSNITLILSGTNRVQAGQPGQAGIGCGGYSNITFMAVNSGSLAVKTFDDAAAIGTATSGLCDRLRFINGTYTTTSMTRATGIGAGSGGTSDAIVNEIVIEGGQYVLATARGAAIGPGFAGSSLASGVRSITILGAAITVTSQLGTAIGAGYAAYGGRSEVGMILIVDCSLTVPGQLDQMTGIGSGATLSGRASHVSNITIVNG
jgi:hypothetical protein